MEYAIGLLAPLLIYAYITFLHAVLPARRVRGYVTKTNSTEKLTYRLNGLPVLFAVVLTWAALGYFDVLPLNWLYLHRWAGLVSAVILGLIFSFALVWPYPAVRSSFLMDFFLGRLENPQFRNGFIDAKMWLYLVGAVMLELNILSFAAHHHLLYGEQASIGFYLATGLLTFFIVDYLTFEEVHLYTYDFFAELVGFKLGWGCLAFYPFFYSIPFWSTVELPVVYTPNYLLILFALVFFLSWGLSRGANLQKYYFKKDPTRAFLGIQPKTISDGKHTLLVNGFWGLSRHINYLGEIGMATAIVLCIGHLGLLWPWLYPLYYMALLLPRQRDDDARCAEKYGPLWDTYLKQVPHRIVPLVY